jgi:RNA polymerase sigma-70 factor (ECF subfamily)
MTHEAEVIQGCLRNHAGAQKKLYDAYAPQMLGVCYRYTKSLEDAHDVLQEGFIRVFKNLHTWRGDGPLAAWIRRIMVTSALNWLRSRKQLELNEGLEKAEAAHVWEGPGPLESLQAKQIADIIRQLPAGFQTVFNLYAIEGYSHAEIAEMLSIKEATSRSQYLRARMTIIKMLEDAGAEKITDYATR